MEQSFVMKKSFGWQERDRTSRHVAKGAILTLPKDAADIAILHRLGAHIEQVEPAVEAPAKVAAKK